MRAKDGRLAAFEERATESEMVPAERFELSNTCF
jgi:hypothetical protein